MLKSIAVCLSLSLAALPVHAKIIHRQAYKVCEAQEEAYWNGSSAQCCDTSKGKYKLVKNYKNGVGEAGYACCQIKEDEKTSENDSIYTRTGYTIVGAANGSCCGGWVNNVYHYTSSYTDFQNFSYSIRENGSIYYCGEEMQALEDYSDISFNYGHYYESNSKFCDFDDRMPDYTSCYCSDRGDPQNGNPC